MAKKYVKSIKFSQSGETYYIRDAEAKETLEALSPRVDDLDTAVAGKQDKLTAGTNITIDENNVISATGGSGTGAVDSVNGKTGVVELTAADVGAATAAQGALADTAVQPAAISDMETQTHAGSTYQTKLTSDNAGDNVTITEVSGVMKINATGSGGTSSYSALNGKPEIEGHELASGNNTAASLGLATSSELSSKQDTINDLETIRSGAAAGATALQSSSLKTINNESLVGSGDIEVLTSSDVGTMAAEDKDDYYTKTAADAEFLTSKSHQTITDTSVTLATLYYNTVYTCSNPIDSLTITAFGSTDTDLEATLYFTTDTTFTMSLPATAKYSPLQPIMRPETSYVMSVVNGIVVIGTIA